MTNRLYLADPRLLSFDAHVVAARTHGEHPALVLDRSAFYPEGGGQPADRGTLRFGDAAVPVLDVQEVEGEVLHVLGGHAPAGAEVRGEVDAARRRDHVQQHHGQHLLSAAFEAHFTSAAAGTAGGLGHTLSFHLGEETCTIDLDVPIGALGPAVLRAVEARANDLVWRDLPVEARDFAPDELARLPLRKEPAKGSRVVVVGEAGAIADASPCGGTHPRRTGEVGAIAVLRAQRWSQGARVEFVCGGRAVAALAAAGERLGAAAAALKCAAGEVPAAVARAAEEASARRKDVEKLLQALAEKEALSLSGPDAVVQAAVTAPVAGAPAWLRALAFALAAQGKTALLGAVEDGRAHLCFARPKGPGPHLGEALKAAVALLGGKGGGAPDSAQGSGPAVGMLEAALGEAAARLGAIT
ncbi:MAG: alanyl-tRNA editing protein [Anaeromyxobacteraceae bacterium]